MVRLRTLLLAAAFLVPACAAAQVSGNAQLSLPILGSTPEVDRVERILASRVNLSFGDMTLDGFAQMLRQVHGLNVLMDLRALDDVGLEPTVRVPAVDLRHTVLEEGINLVLDQLDLAIMVRDSTLVITTPEESENHLEYRVYPVADLVRVAAGSTRYRNPWYADYDRLIETITSTIAPDTWDEVGGAGSMEPFPSCHALVIGQERKVHRDIRALLATLRRVRSMQGIEAPGLPRSVPPIGSRPYGSQSYSNSRVPTGYPGPPDSGWRSSGGYF